MTEQGRGRHLWYELMTTDPAGAKAFYGAVIGWTSTPFEGADPPYDIWNTEHGPIGGVMELPEQAAADGAPSHWMGYIATPDTDATTARARELGGGVLVSPSDIPTVGRFAVIQDPFGARFVAFTPAKGGTAAPPRPRPGEVSWHELMSDDYLGALAFYVDLFGWEKGDAIDMGPAGTYQLVRVQGAASDFGGMMNRPPEMPVSTWLYYINVSDLDAAVERVGAHGGQVLHGPMEVPGGDRVCLCQDPQGGAFALHSYASE